MAILPLPEDSVRRLGSTLVITSPVALLKELLDNAIDSGATTIDVLTSSNTVDKIEVRDNGHGINTREFDCLGRPGHTSKIRSFEELDTLGGKTLGFRGVALASITTLGNVSITTRVSSEPVATMVCLAKQGGVSTQRHAAAPVGTTVTVTGLFSHLPVRLQITLKESHRYLARMKDILQSYALAKPDIRLRFAVIKTPGLSWTYSPHSNGGIKEAATQLFGIELASQFVYQVYSSSNPQQQSGPLADMSNPDQLAAQTPVTAMFEALVPKPTADFLKITGGAFLSVDNRPISPTRGTPKKLVSLFKQHLERHFVGGRHGSAVRDPFLVLNIRLPPGSYDVNVEASKDDVLFRDEQHILDQFDAFISTVYATGGQHPLVTTSEATSLIEVERRAQAALGTPAQCSSPQQQDATPGWRVDMSTGVDGMSDGDDGDDLETRATRQPQPRADIENEIGDRNNEAHLREGLNPWSIAKITGTNKHDTPLTGSTQSQHSVERQPQEHVIAIHGQDGASPERRQRHSLNSQPEPRTGHSSQVGNPASQGRPLRDLFEHKPRGPRIGFTQPRGRQGVPSRRSRLRSPPTSSPPRYDRGENGSREPCRMGGAARSARSVQSQISFNGNSKRPEPRFETHLNPTQREFGTSRVGGRLGGPARTKLADPYDLDVTTASPTQKRRQIHTREVPASYPRVFPSVINTEEGTMGTRARETIDGSTAQPRLPSDDPRAQFITHGRLVTNSGHKSLRRLNTEQLPLEVTPRDCETCALLLSMTTDSSSLEQLIPTSISVR
ncbi:hypothetical protein B0J18DRAFT_126813 [Chaetomium sp. MPI-SDFR-AT-0129]|nr:hypothetical protein B0J18DRAFT_126813 [Chaetomium sp. MPI-SDFR-AT-0129]